MNAEGACSILLPLLMKVAMALNLELVSSLPYAARVSTSLLFTGPAMNLAVERANRQFSGTLNMSLVLLYDERDQKCPDVTYTIIDKLTRHYYKNRQKDACVAIIATSTL